MKIQVHLWSGESGTPLEFANELIRMEIDGRSPHGFDRGVSWLAEMAEYIMVFVKHNERSSNEADI